MGCLCGLVGEADGMGLGLHVIFNLIALLAVKPFHRNPDIGRVARKAQRAQGLTIKDSLRSSRLLRVLCG